MLNNIDITKELSTLEITLLESSHQEELSALLNEVFECLPHQNYLDDFPVWNLTPKKFESIRTGIFHNGKLVSTVGARMAEIKIRNVDQTLKVALLGGVGTKRTHGGQGLVKKQIDCCMEWAKNQGAEMVLLWASNPTLYEKFGFQLCGMQSRVLLKEIIKDITTDETVTIKTGMNLKLFEKIRQRQDGICLEVQDYEWYSLHKNVSWFYIEKNEKISAYIGVNRGLDLKNIVHEWGGSEKHLKQLLKYYLEINPDAEFLAPKARMQNFVKSDLLLEYFCMSKMFNPKSIFEKINFKNKTYGFGKFGAKYFLTNLSNEESFVLESHQLERIFFGPDRLEYELSKDKLFPVEMWLYGLDAV